MGNSKIRLPIILAAILCITAFSACSQQNTSSGSSAESQTSSQASNSSSSAAEAQSVTYGKVTAVDGLKITMALGTLKGGEPPKNSASGGGKKTAPPSGSGSAPNGGKSGSAPSGSGTNPGGQKSGNNPGHGGADMLTLTGKTTTITISDTSIIKKQDMGMPNGKQNKPNTSGSVSSSSSGSSSVSLSDIKVGTILGITKGSDGSLSSVTIIGESGTNNSSASSQK